MQFISTWPAVRWQLWNNLSLFGFEIALFIFLWVIRLHSKFEKICWFLVIEDSIHLLTKLWLNRERYENRVELLGCLGLGKKSFIQRQLQLSKEFILWMALDHVVALHLHAYKQTRSCNFLSQTKPSFSLFPFQEPVCFVHERYWTFKFFSVLTNLHALSGKNTEQSCFLFFLLLLTCSEIRGSAAALMLSSALPSPSQCKVVVYVSLEDCVEVFGVEVCSVEVSCSLAVSLPFLER